MQPKKTNFPVWLYFIAPVVFGINRFMSTESKYFLFNGIAILLGIFGLFVVMAALVAPRSKLVLNLHSRVLGSNANFNLTALKIGGILLFVGGLAFVNLYPEPERFRLERVEQERIEAQKIIDQKAEAARLETLKIKQAQRLEQEQLARENSERQSVAGQGQSSTETARVGDFFKTKCQLAIDKYFDGSVDIDFATGSDLEDSEEYQTVVWRVKVTETNQMKNYAVTCLSDAQADVKSLEVNPE